MAETEAAAEPVKARPAEPWLRDIDKAFKRDEKWREKGKKIVQRFRDERDNARSSDSSLSSKVNILWSNTEVLKSALYSRTAAPDVRRRFPDARKGDELARTIAEIIERSLSYCIDAYDVDSPIEAALEDNLLPGRGVAWVNYDPEVEGEGEEAQITSQKLDIEYVYWEDFCHGLARTWKRVPWVCRRHAMREDEFSTKFPEAKFEPGYELKDASGAADAGEASGEKFVEVFEVWDKPSKTRIWVGRGVTDVLREDEDPLQLTDFFPCPKPLYGVTTTDRLVPEPEYCQYQDQAIELDEVSSRIRHLTNELRWRGIYDASVDGENQLANLPKAGDGVFLPYKNWMTLREKGGIDQAVGFWPVEKIVQVLRELYPRANMLIQQIYQVTGISDIIRGATDPNETKGAQVLKAQFGSMRMQRRQRDVQRFIRDLYRMKGEIIAEHFTQETLAAITGIDLPTREEVAQYQMRQQMQAMQAQMPPQALPPQPMGMRGAPPMQAQTPALGAPIPTGGAAPVMGGMPPRLPAPPPVPPPDSEMAARMSGPTWEDVMAILRSDKMRAYRVDVETDATAFVDAEAEKKGRVEMMTAMQGMLQGAFQMIQMAPGTIPLVKELLMFGLRSWKPARTLEESFEDAFDELEKNPPQPPAAGKKEDGPDPAVAAADIKKVELEEKKLLADKDYKDKQLILEKDKLEADKIAKVADYNLRRAAQNKQLVDEAKAEIEGEAGQGAPPPGAAPPPMSPLEAIMQSIASLTQVLAAGQEREARQAAIMTELMGRLTAPKRIVRGEDGRAVGVETIN